MSLPAVTPRRGNNPSTDPGRLARLYGTPAGSTPRSSAPAPPAQTARRPRPPAEVTTWWDAPDMKPVPPSKSPEPPPSRRPRRLGQQVAAPAMDYRSSVLEERMLLTAVKRRRNELVGGSSTGSGKGLLTAGSTGSALSTASRPDPWEEALQERHAELRAELTRSRDLVGGSGSSTSAASVQRWLSAKRREMQLPGGGGQGKDQLDRVMYFLETGRQAVAKGDGSGVLIDDIMAAFESQKQRHRINSRWAEAIERSNRDLQYISKYRQRERQREVVPPSRERQGPSRGAERDLVTSRESVKSQDSGSALPSAGPSIEGAASAEGDVAPSTPRSTQPDGTDAKNRHQTHTFGSSRRVVVPFEDQIKEEQAAMAAELARAKAERSKTKEEKQQSLEEEARARKAAHDSEMLGKCVRCLQSLSYGHKGQDPRKLFTLYDRDNSGELDFVRSARPGPQLSLLV